MRRELPAQPRAGFPALTADQMREVDRIMVEELGIDLTRMMENAGRNLADLVIRLFRPATVTVLAGSGGNGGGGLVAARHLSNRGVAVTVSVSGGDLAEVPARQLAILENMTVAVTEQPVEAEVVIDALIGYSLSGPPRDRAAELIGWANERSTPVVSLDTPSGLDVTTGVAAEPSVVADATLTLALPKIGLLEAAQVGDLYLADISVPPAVYRRFGIDLPELFAEETVIRLA